MPSIADNASPASFGTGVFFCAPIAILGARQVAGWLRAAQAVRGKSGLHGSTVTGNTRRGQPQGKRHRNDTAHRPKAAARLKWCGKSAPRLWQQRWHGKPHREQDQIGTAGDRFPDRRPGGSREVRSDGHPRGIAIYPRKRWTEPGLQATWRVHYRRPVDAVPEKASQPCHFQATGHCAKEKGPRHLPRPQGKRTRDN